MCQAICYWRKNDTKLKKLKKNEDCALKGSDL